MNSLKFCLILGLFLLSGPSYSQSLQTSPGPLIAQSEGGDDAYDPFADYSEFDEGEEEEADVNFFRNGRFFTIGLAIGQRRFTSVLGDIYEPGSTFGGFLSYFFDLRWALQIGYLTDNHALKLKTPTRTFTGNLSLSSTSFHVKYFMSTQNVTRGLSAINPFVIAGLSQVYRTAQIAGASGYSRDGTMSFDAGGGVEVPVMRGKMYVGAQFIYHGVNFSDENVEIQFEEDTGIINKTGIVPQGDAWSGTAIFGINF